MDFLNDLRSKLPFRGQSSRASHSQQPTDYWSLVSECGHFLLAEVDRTGLIRSANPALCELRGAPREDLVGTSLLFLAHAEDRSPVSAVLRETFATRGAGEVLARLLTNGESTPRLLWSILPLPDEQDEVRSALCLGINLTSYLHDAARSSASVEALQALREAQAGLEKENHSLHRKLERQKAAAQLPRPNGPVPGLTEEDANHPPTLAELERRYILHTLEQCRGRVSGAKGAAAILGLHPNTLRSRMEKLGVERVA